MLRWLWAPIRSGSALSTSFHAVDCIDTMLGRHAQVNPLQSHSLFFSGGFSSRFVSLLGLSPSGSIFPLSGAAFDHIRKTGQTYHNPHNKSKCQQLLKVTSLSASTRLLLGQP
ncbi:hypothetical protein PYCCODRAFT_620744 [Trametes coccinea BRFM310]|uniref:Uncharacterized protein n=1 Tax=Trametes coccinea (strain BRFM310) TaxID=1353009 RepID=A0A1Y2J4Z4_TRAC3|nr:hypothetical protein PYCCODRAFT_620744 [Trametes coccinea BRFM310]